MTAGGLIDAVLDHGTDIQGSQTILQEADVRTRALFFLQAGCEWFAGLYPFRWRHTDSTASAVDSASSSWSLPADFHAFGTDCQVIRSADNFVLEPRSDAEVRRLVRTHVSTAAPSMWSPGSNLWINVWPSGNNDSLILENYLRAVATLVDNQTDQIDMIPAQYHRTLLFDYVVSKLFFGYGDDRSVELDARIRQLSQQAIADENLTPVKQRLPRYGRVRGR